MGKEQLDAALTPIYAALKGAEPNDGATLAARLAKELPLTHPAVAAVRAAATAGVKEGWLCNREGGGIRFSRPVKPSEASAG